MGLGVHVHHHAVATRVAPHEAQGPAFEPSRVRNSACSAPHHRVGGASAQGVSASRCHSGAPGPCTRQTAWNPPQAQQGVAVWWVRMILRGRRWRHASDHPASEWTVQSCAFHFVHSTASFSRCSQHRTPAPKRCCCRLHGRSCAATAHDETARLYPAMGLLTRAVSSRRIRIDDAIHALPTVTLRRRGKHAYASLQSTSHTISACWSFTKWPYPVSLQYVTKPGGGDVVTSYDT